MALAYQAGALALNLVSGIGVVLANKLVFTLGEFRFPTALTSIHYATNYAVLLGIAAASPSRDDRAGAKPKLDRQLLATTAVWAVHNALSNLSLSRNSVGLYQISKVLVTPLIVLLEYGVYGAWPAPRLALALVGACAGVALATVSDVSFQTRGAVTAAASACASALLKVLQQDVLQRRNWSSLELMRTTWGWQLLLLLLCIPLLDVHAADLPNYHFTPTRTGVLLLSAAAGFALNLSSLVAIKMTSAIAIVLLSQGKTAVTMLGGYLFFDGQPNARQLFGAALALTSLGAYSYGSAVLHAQGRSRLRPSEPAVTDEQAGDTIESVQQLEKQPLRGGAAAGEAAR